MNFQDKRLLRILQGLLLAWGAPLGWLLIRIYNGADWHYELTVNWAYYAYLLVGTMTVFFVFGVIVGGSEERLEELAITDAITGLYNQRYLQVRLPEEFARAQRYRQHLSLILLDIDHFEVVGETQGAAATEQLLQNVGSLLKQQARRGEFVARVGGKRFCIVLIECDERQAVMAGERFLAAVRQQHINGANGQPVTASIGLVSSQTTQGDEWHLYQVADAACSVLKVMVVIKRH